MRSQATTPALAAVILLYACGGDTPVDPGPTGTVNQPPTASFTMDVTAGPAPLEVRFDGSASADPDGTIASYSWSFGDGATGTGATTTHAYAEPGAYTPTLTVTDQRGATASATGSRITVSSPVGSGENAVAGTVWHDADADGQRDAGEDPVPGMLVYLDADADGVRDAGETTVLTDAEGRYRFDGLDDGTHRVTQDLTIGWTNTAAGVDLARASRPAAAVLTASSPARIIGGQPAAEGEFPFQVALVTTGTDFQFCGGSWIAARWVVTASHCVDGGLDVSTIKVKAGTADLRTGGERLDVQRVIIHPSFSATAFVENDIALIELTEPYAYPRIELLTPDRAVLAEPGDTATVIGWGRTSISAGSGSPVLKKLRAPIISNDECRTALDQNILPATICAGRAGGTESVCNGDSGGPLMVPFLSRWIQIGIVSFGANICYQPTAFARVSALVTFVRNNVSPEASRVVEVELGGGSEVQVDFGDFR